MNTSAIDTESLGNEFLDALRLLERAHNWVDDDTVRREICRFLETHKTAAKSMAVQP